jgi:hypothetical protein
MLISEAFFPEDKGHWSYVLIQVSFAEGGTATSIARFVSWQKKENTAIHHPHKAS